jgi:hypothetical protein
MKSKPDFDFWFYIAAVKNINLAKASDGNKKRDSGFSWDINRQIPDN